MGIGRKNWQFGFFKPIGQGRSITAWHLVLGIGPHIAFADVGIDRDRIIGSGRSITGNSATIVYIRDTIACVIFLLQTAYVGGRRHRVDVVYFHVSPRTGAPICDLYVFHNARVIGAGANYWERSEWIATVDWSRFSAVSAI